MVREDIGIKIGWNGWCKLRVFQMVECGCRVIGFGGNSQVPCRLGGQRVKEAEENTLIPPSNAPTSGSAALIKMTSSSNFNVWEDL